MEDKMKKLVLTAALIVLICSQMIQAQIPQKISYQGVLKLVSDVIVPDGEYNLTFKIYDVPEGGDSLWVETQFVSVKNGILDAILGSVNPINLAFDKPYWVGVTVEEFPELAPRIEFTAVPYSFHSQVADTALTSLIAEGSVTEAKLANAAVSQTKLKTSTEEQSTNTGGMYLNLTFSSVGSYGFYPQVKGNFGSNPSNCAIVGRSIDFGGSYVTNIGIDPDEPDYAYARIRYITSSSNTHWVYLLIAKKDLHKTDDEGHPLLYKKGTIMFSRQGPDHPSCGSGKDDRELPHPFDNNYNPEEHELVLVDNAILPEL
jgi:hypothetical protein